MILKKIYRQNQVHLVIEESEDSTNDILYNLERYFTIPDFYTFVNNKKSKKDFSMIDRGIPNGIKREHLLEFKKWSELKNVAKEFTDLYPVYFI